MTPFPIGQYGLAAAQQFKQVSPQKRHETTIQYNPTGEGRQAFSDLVAYADAFEKSPNCFTADDIEAATGLDLTKLPQRQQIETILDINHDGHVDTAEMVTTLAYLDSAESVYSTGQCAFDGRITEADRTAFENSLGSVDI